MLRIRSEEEADAGAIRALHEAAFPTDAEATLVDALRTAGRLSISLVAVDRAVVVGHVALSPVEIVGRSPTNGAGLGPLAVAAAHRRRGIGGALVREAIARAARRGIGFVVVLGEPRYYTRFGFGRSSERGLGNEYGATDEFMVLELEPRSLPREGGLVRYAREFSALGQDVT
jgi:putative acetyltransferase